MGKVKPNEKLVTIGDICLTIRNEDNERMDRELVAKLIPVEGGEFTAKEERPEGRVRPLKKDIFQYAHVFSQGYYMSDETDDFLEKFFPHREGLQSLAQSGYSVDFWLLTPKVKRSGIVQEVPLKRELLEKLAQTGVNFVLDFGASYGIRRKKVKNSKLLDKFERRFLHRYMNMDYCTCLVKCFERGENKPAYRHKFVYRSDKKKLQGLKYVLKQVDERHKAGALKRPALLRLYCYHAWYDEQILFSPKFLRRLADLKVDLEFNWYSGGF